MEPGSIKLLYLCHDSFPSFESRTEQIVQSMSALSAHGFETTLVIPETAVRSAAARAKVRHLIARRSCAVDELLDGDDGRSF